MNTMADSFENILQELGKLPSDWWKDDSGKGKATECMEGLWSEYLGAHSERRGKLLSSIPRRYSGTFLQYAHRMAVDAVRDGDIQHLISGTTSLVMENGLIDARDTIIVFALLWHSALKLGQDPNQLFQPIAAEAHQPFLKFLRDFVTRPPAQRDISKFGYSEGLSNGQFDYIPI